MIDETTFMLVFISLIAMMWITLILGEMQKIGMI